MQAFKINIYFVIVQNWNVFAHENKLELNKCFYFVQKLTYCGKKKGNSELFDVTNSRNSAMIRWIILVCG